MALTAVTWRAMVNELERGTGLTSSGRCGTCGGDGREGGSLMVMEGDEIPPQPGCEECGATGVSQTAIVIHDGPAPRPDDASGAGRPGVG